MASYDRRILVPYLQDVCCAEMLCAKLEREITECQSRVNNSKAYIDQKEGTNVEPKALGGKKRFALWAALAFAVPAFCFCGSFFGTLCFFACCGLICLFFHKIKKMNQKTEEYQMAMAEYKAVTEKLESHKLMLQRESKCLTALRSRYADVSALRDSLYNVNIIPSKYRDICAVYYLHDYFRTSRETDLDKIIQTMLLDDIRRQLKMVVVQNEEILLNLRAQTALQEKNNRMMTENHQREMQQLINMESNQQLQMDYQKMIIENQKVTNYFLEDEYWRNRGKYT